MSVVHVQWEGPLDREAMSKADQAPTDFGVYQVYGSHPVYGLKTLLYIGKAQDQTFARRLSQHGWWFDRENGQGELSFFLGRLAGSTTPSDAEWGLQIAQVEGVLLVAHKPSYNAQSIKDLGNMDNAIGHLHVLNWGSFGSLLPEVSAARWTQRLTDPPNYDLYGKHSKSPGKPA